MRVPPVLAARALAGWTDPAVLHANGPARAAHSFWLDAGPGATSGWSLLGIGMPGDPDAPRGVPVAPATRAPLPVPFAGGWIGWLGYDEGAARAGAPASTDDTAPTRMWLEVDRFVAVDHARKTLWAAAPPGELADFVALVESWRAGAPEATIAPPPRIAHARHTSAAYAELIERCRAAIREGDAYQLCLTTRFDVPASDGGVDAVAAYLALREATPAHHGGLLRSGPHALASASPERFLEIGDGIVRTRPIKGTRPRGADAATDAALAADLRASPKERAENVMIVDLMRNDLQRVCLPGTVAVEELLVVESYPAVHQLVSAVGGRLQPGRTMGDVLDAAFPAGSMTGAPKLSAMTILHGLEGGPRGVFAGCFGWVGHDGAADLAMVIRSIVVHPGGAWVGAGGGITWGSESAAEVAEVGVKARGPLAALGADLPPGW